jgi:hypothetical protein
MQYLPKIEYNEKRPSTIYLANNKSKYHEFLGRLEELLIGDVWAIVIDDEIIFNSYEPKSIKAQIQENIIRREISNYPHTLFSNMLKQKKDGQVIFYMYGYETWYVIINYTANTESLKIDYCKSQKYVTKYNNKEIILF